MATVDVANNKYPPSLGPGEQSAIALAMTLACPVLMDDKLARHFAQAKNLVVIGTVGTLVKAKQVGLLDELAPLFDTLKQQGYYISTNLVEQAKRLAGE